MPNRQPFFLFLWTALISAVPGPGFAEPGLDFLGIKIDSGWNCDQMLAPLRSRTRAIPIGWLDDTTFGTSTACLERLLASGKVSKARAHLLNNTCVRNKNCWSGDRLNGYTLDRIQREALSPGSPLLDLVCQGAKTIEGYAKRYPAVRFRVSGLLEHNMTREAAIAVAAEVRRCAPDMDVVDNPIYDPRTLYPPIPEAIRESHGPTVNPITSLDGISVEAVDVDSWKEKNAASDMTLIWALSYNCRFAEGWIQPNLRKNCPTADQFALYTELLGAGGPVPKSRPPQCASVPRAAPPWFYKSSAEDDGSGKAQANKPLVTSPAKAARLDVLDAKGNILGWMKQSGFAPGGLPRYYLGLGSGETAYQIGQKAAANTGSEWIVLSVGSNCVWVNPYRSGPFKNE